MYFHSFSIYRYLCFFGIAQGHVFSLTVGDAFTLNPLDVGCALIDILVLDTLFMLLAGVA